MSEIELLVMVVLVFTAIKTIFTIIQWVFEDNGDKFLRRHLDSLFDQLDKLTVRQVAELGLRRTLESIAKHLPLSSFPKPKIILAFLLLNVVAYIIAQSIYCHAHNDCANTLGHDYEIQKYGVGRLFLWFLIDFTGSTIIQLISLWLTWQFLKRMFAHFNIYTALIHLVISIGLLILLFLTQYSLQQGARYIAFNLPPSWEKLIPNIWTQSPYFIVTLILSLAASLPTVIYVIAQGSSFLLWVMPDWARISLRWLVYRITTDKTPVLQRLGLIMGGVIALCSAIIGYLKV